MVNSEKTLVRFLKVSMWSLVYLIVVPFIIGIFAYAIPIAGPWVAAALVITGLATLVWPLERFGLYHKLPSISAVVGGLIALGLAITAAQDYETKRLADLRITDPASYLSELKGSNSEEWLKELAVLAPDEFTKEMDRQATKERRKRAEELERRAEVEKAAAAQEKAAVAARQKQIDELEDEAQSVPASDTNQNILLYEQLSKLSPDNQKYREKLNHYIGIRDLKKNQERSPEKFVKIVEFSWSKKAFGTIMELDITLKNELPFSIKDIEIHCDHYAPSGTKIDSNNNTIFEVIPPGKTRSFEDFDMGFIHTQATRTGCRIASVARM